MLLNAALGIHQVRLPLPFKLNHVNCYAVQGRQGWWLVDTGLNYEPSRQIWLQFMAENAIKDTDIRGIYITHFHPDHFGASGWLQEKTGAPVYISAIDAAAVERTWHNSAQAIVSLQNMFQQNGMPKDMTEGIAGEMNKLAQLTQPHPSLTLIQPDGMVTLGDYQYRVLLTPGHSDGHVCFYNAEQGVLLSGDHLLPKITSNISWWPEAAADPLNNYLESINSLRSLRVQTVLPAHGQPFGEMEARIDQLAAHHAERLAQIRDLAAPGARAFEVCRQAFRQDLSLHELRFAMAETLSHLMYLVNRGELKLDKANLVFTRESN